MARSLHTNERMVERSLLVAFAFCTTLGCGSQEHLLAKISGSQMGCAADDVLISDVQRSGSRPRTWTATCREKAWECKNTWGRVVCRERADAPSGPAVDGGTAALSPAP